MLAIHSLGNLLAVNVFSTAATRPPSPRRSEGWITVGEGGKQAHATFGRNGTNLPNCHE